MTRWHFLFYLSVFFTMAKLLSTCKRIINNLKTLLE
jgi:hypothetical protein